MANPGRPRPSGPDRAAHDAQAPRPAPGEAPATSGKVGPIGMASFAMVAVSYLLALVHAFAPGGAAGDDHRPQAVPVAAAVAPPLGFPEASPGPAATAPTASISGASAASAAAGSLAAVDAIAKDAVSDAVGPEAAGPAATADAAAAETASARAGELFRDADLAHGAALIAEHDCNACHQRNVGGDGLRIYRPAGRINSPGRLVTMVEFCNTQLGLQLFPEDVTSISAVLNRDHYRFD